ncbi:MAG: hypothetical protein Q9216_002539 [Gyalolechia sp. 2 TL-2023]
MHRVKQWAHVSARSDTYSGWSPNASPALTTSEPSAASTSSPADNVRDDREKEKDTPKAPVWKRFAETLKKICLSSWVNVLLVFVPVGIAVYLAKANPTIVFAMNAIAIIPLAGLLAFATESVAHRLGDTLGALLNVSFGNAVELIIFIALVKNEIRIVQASLVGSILANLLLILGMSFLIGGLRYQEQLKSHAYLYVSTPQHIVDEESYPGILRKMRSSRSSSVASLSTTGSAGSRRITRKKIRARLGRKRQSKVDSEVENADDPEQSTIRTQNTRLEVPSTVHQLSASSGESAFPRVRPGGPYGLASLSIRPPPVFRTNTEPMLRNMSATRASPSNIRYPQSISASDQGLMVKENSNSRQCEEPDTSSEPPLSKTASVFLLLGSTALVALCAEFMVTSISELVLSTPLSEAFVGLIILPIVGNAAEHVTAVAVAAKNKMDLAIGVAVGSSIQIATFITPLVVVIGWVLDKDMPLYFTLFETMTLFVATFVVNFLVLDGRSNYLEGSLLCSAYIIIA